MLQTNPFLAFCNKLAGSATDLLYIFDGDGHPVSLRQTSRKFEYCARCELCALTILIRAEPTVADTAANERIVNRLTQTCLHIGCLPSIIVIQQTLDDTLSGCSDCNQ
jgi:hypothetical protein